MAYLDECGFAQTHPNRRAWTPVGQQHCVRAAPKGKRLNVMAALLCNASVHARAYWENTNSDVFIGFVYELFKLATKPLTIILDNASMHHAKAIRPHLKHLQRHGLTLYFLPAYSPELNRIEKLWWQIKHRWMGVCWRDKDTLEQQVTALLGKVGSELEFKF